MELKGSKTEQNLMTAFAGESQARNKYTYFASKAKKDGYEQIAAIFEETANNEKEHASLQLPHCGLLRRDPAGQHGGLAQGELPESLPEPRWPRPAGPDAVSQSARAGWKHHAS